MMMISTSRNYEAACASLHTFIIESGLVAIRINITPGSCEFVVAYPYPLGWEVGRIVVEALQQGSRISYRGLPGTRGDLLQGVVDRLHIQSVNKSRAAYSREEREKIVEQYRIYCAKGGIAPAADWVKKYGISAKTLKRYLEEFA